MAILALLAYKGIKHLTAGRSSRRRPELRSACPATIR
jgi:hypothetical protein